MESDSSLLLTTFREIETVGGSVGGGTHGNPCKVLRVSARDD
jgi:hypothetical protein